MWFRHKQVSDTLVGAHEKVHWMQLPHEETMLGLMYLDQSISTLGGGRRWWW